VGIAARRRRQGGGDQREVVLASHFLTDLTLGLGEVVYDYLEDA
jgi:hypothetical protein